MAAGVMLVALAYAREASGRLALSAGALARAALPMALAAGNAVLVVTALYVAYTPVGEPALWLQGRYLLPIAAASVVALMPLKPRPLEDERPSPLPLLPLIAVLLVYLSFKVPLYFYR
jgi:hypothetical protein